MLGKVIQAVLHCVAEIDEDRAIHRKPEGPKVIPRAFVRLVLQQGFFYMHHPIDRIAHTTAFVTPVVENWLERGIGPMTHRTGNK